MELKGKKNKFKGCLGCLGILIIGIIIITVGCPLITNTSSFPDKKTEKEYEKSLSTKDYIRARELASLIDNDIWREMKLKEISENQIQDLFMIEIWSDANDILGYYYFSKWDDTISEYGAQETLGFKIVHDYVDILNFTPFVYSLVGGKALQVEGSEYDFEYLDNTFNLVNKIKDGLYMKLEYSETDFVGILHSQDGTTHDVVLSRIHDQNITDITIRESADSTEDSGNSSNSPSEDANSFVFKSGTVEMSIFGYSLSHLYDFTFKFSRGELGTIIRDTDYDGKMFSDTFKLNKNYTSKISGNEYLITLYYDNEKIKTIGNLKIDRSGNVYYRDGNQWRKAQINKGSVQFK